MAMMFENARANHTSLSWLCDEVFRSVFAYGLVSRPEAVLIRPYATCCVVWSSRSRWCCWCTTRATSGLDAADLERLILDLVDLKHDDVLRFRTDQEP